MRRKLRRIDAESDSVAGGRQVAYDARMKTPPASQRVRLRLKEELAARDISQRELAEILTQQTEDEWTQSTVGKVLNGNVELTVDDADAIAKALRLFLTEAVRDRGLEFYAEMTPTELRLLEMIRKDANLRQGFLIIAGLSAPAEIHREAKLKRKRGRPLNSDLAKRGA
jgi:transcriptional regulator with XRE-family HTH domain